MSNLQITPRDFKIFVYIWLWKCLSTQAIAEKFFPQVTPMAAYVRLLKLERSGFICSRLIDENRGSVWCLTKKSFDLIKGRISNLDQMGYKPLHIYHDALVSAFHLGDWLIHQPKFTQTFSEQQLRQIHPDYWEKWIPKDNSHKPDGYSLIFNEEKPIVVSFEVELWTKAKPRYQRLIDYYDNQSSVQIVLWLVTSRNTINSLRRIFDDRGSTQWCKHHFVLLSDFKVKGWMSEIFEGQNKGKTVSDLLNPQPFAKPLQSPFTCKALALQNFQKRPINTGHYANF